MTAEAAKPVFLTVEDVAKRWGVNKDHVYDLHRRGTLKASRISKRPLRFPLTAVQAVEAATR